MQATKPIEFQQIEHDEIRKIRNRLEFTDTATCCGDLMIAPLWIDEILNLGSVARTCDAVNACYAVANHSRSIHSYLRGNTLGRKDFRPHSVRKRVHIHLVGDDEGFYPSRTPIDWLAARSDEGYHILAVEISSNATILKDLTKHTKPTIVLLGHEKIGIPNAAWKYVDEVVEIPMVGAGLSLNVAVSASLVLYKLRNMI